MNRKFTAGMALTIALLLANFGIARGQEAPEPPEPPDSGQFYVFGEGSVHLGVTLGDVTAEKAQELKLPAVAGAMVNKVQKDSAAAKAGIEPGDVIVEFDGVHVRSSAELRRLIRETPAGRTVAIKLVRGGKPSVVSAKLEASNNRFEINMPEIHVPEINTPEIHVPEIHIPPITIPSGFGRAALGITGQDLTPQLVQYFGVKQGKGVLVFEVTTGGAGDKAGLKAGDVIVQVDGQPISGVEQLRSALNENFSDDTRKVSVTIIRDHHEQTVNAELSRSRPREKRTSGLEGLGNNKSLEQLRAEAAQQRAAAARLREEIQKQQEQMKGVWQQQLQEQMRALKDQLRQMQDRQLALFKDGEI
jgi:C-terminal processing protease CtpA/Prc